MDTARVGGQDQKKKKKTIFPSFFFLNKIHHSFYCLPWVPFCSHIIYLELEIGGINGVQKYFTLSLTPGFRHLSHGAPEEPCCQWLEFHPHPPVVEVLTSRGRVGSPEPGSTTQILGLLETLQLCNRMNPTHAPSYEDPQEWWWQCSPLAGVAERHSLVGGPHWQQRSQSSTPSSWGGGEISAQGPCYERSLTVTTGAAAVDFTIKPCPRSKETALEYAWG